MIKENAATFNEYLVFWADSQAELQRSLNNGGREHYKMVHLERLVDGKVLVVMERVTASA